MKTISIKLLAEKVLQRNHRRNIEETPGFHPGKPPAEKFPLPVAVSNVSARVSLPASLEDFQTFFERANAEVQAAYLPGTLKLLQEKYPELWTEIQEAEDRINELWLKARQGTANLKVFQDAVIRWQSLLLKGIELANNKYSGDNQ